MIAGFGALPKLDRTNSRPTKITVCIRKQRTLLNEGQRPACPKGQCLPALKDNIGSAKSCPNLAHVAAGVAAFGARERRERQKGHRISLRCCGAECFCRSIGP